MASISSQPILGLATLHSPWWNRETNSPELTLLDQAYAEGYRIMDTALVYGLGASEKALGRWMHLRRNREQLVIITKGGHPRLWRPRQHRLTVECVADDISVSLRRLRCDYIDLYMLHRDAAGCDVPGILQFLDEQVRRGVIREIGVSNWHHSRIANANAVARERRLTPFTASSPQLSLLTWTRPPWTGCVSISGRADADARGWYKDTGMPVLAWSPLAGGISERAGVGWIATGKCYDHAGNRARLAVAAAIARERGITVGQVLIAYVRSLPFPVHPICASRNLTHLRANCAALDFRLAPEEIARLEDS